MLLIAGEYKKSLVHPRVKLDDINYFYKIDGFLLLSRFSSCFQKLYLFGSDKMSSTLPVKPQNASSSTLHNIKHLQVRFSPRQICRTHALWNLDTFG